MNAPDAAKGQKSGRDEEFNAEMEVGAKNFEAEAETEQTWAAGFGAAPAKAVPVNAPDAAKGQKRGRDEEDDAE
jgi:hypothetical protein